MERVVPHSQYKKVKMSDNNLFLESQHPDSLRHAILEDDGTSAWLYLTEADVPKPVADAWVYNRIEAPTRDDVRAFQGGPPPAAEGFAGPTAQCSDPHDHEWSLLWSPTGDSVAVLRDGTPVACIVSGHPHGFSRELVSDGPWGNTWSDEVYRETFDEQA